MSIEQLIAEYLSGEPIHDGIMIGIYFTVFILFYETMFSSVFTIFKK